MALICNFIFQCIAHPRGIPPLHKLVPSAPYTYYFGRTIWLIFGLRSAPIGNWFRGAKIFFAKKRTLGNRLISCSLMTAFGQKRTSSIVMVEQRTENPRVDGSIPSRVTGVQNHCIFTLTSFLPLGLFRPCSRSEKRTQTTSELTCYFLLRPLLHVC